MPPSLAGWHLDKRVPITIFAALLAQTVYFTYWGTSKYDDLDNRIATLERGDVQQATHEGRIITLEQKLDYIRSDLQEIKELLRRQIPDANTPQQ